MIKFSTYKKRNPIFFRVTKKTDRIRKLIYTESRSYMKTFGYFYIGYIRASKNDEWKPAIVGNFTYSHQLYNSSYSCDDLPEIPTYHGKLAGVTFISEDGMMNFVKKTSKISMETFKFLQREDLARYPDPDSNLSHKINFIDYE